MRIDKDFADSLHAQPAFKRELTSQGRAIKAAAKAAAPIGKTGAYARWFVVVEEDGVVRVGNTDFAAHLVEYGSAKNPVYAPLRRGVTAAAMRFEPDPK